VTPSSIDLRLHSGVGERPIICAPVCAEEKAMTHDKQASGWKNRTSGKAGETYTIDHLMEAFGLNKDDAEQLIKKYNGDCERINDFIRARKTRK
jgi:hypothetical protein